MTISAITASNNISASSESEKSTQAASSATQSSLPTEQSTTISSAAAPEDKIEISDESRTKALSLAAEQGDDASVEDSTSATEDTAANTIAESSNTNISSVPSGGSGNAPAPSSASSSSSNSTSSDTGDLSQYTDAQLKQMLSDEKITQMQYDVEISRRESEEKLTSSATNSSSNESGESNTNNNNIYVG